MKKLILIFLILTAISGGQLQAQDTIWISDFGYQPDSRINAVPFVKRAIEACKSKKNPVLVFQKGRYDFWPQYCDEKLYYESNTDVILLRICPILLRNFSDLLIDCKGSDFIFHGRMQPFTIDSCQNLTLRNVNIDWDIPMTAQAQVKAVTDNYIDIEINVLESPYLIENEKIVFVGEGWKSAIRPWGIMEFDRETRLIPEDTGDKTPLGADYEEYKATEISYGLVRMNHQFKRKPAVGNYLILRHSARDHAGTFIADSRNITIENMNMYQNCGLGILAQYSENLTFRNSNFVPNLAKNRYFGGHDDGFHFSSCKGQITIDSCRFLALMDDPINVHGTSVKIIKVLSDKKLVCRFMHDQSYGFVWTRPSETVGFIENEAMNTTGFGIVESFRALTTREFEITFKDPIPLTTEVGDALENLVWVPDLAIRNSFFGSNRARGILVTTPGKVIIENNIFESSGSAILISGDANGWYESGAVKNVLIKNNTFNDPCMTSMYEFCEGIISIFPIIPKPDINKPFHRNIRIENNTFHPFDYPVLYAKSTEGLSFNNNKIIRSTRFNPFHQSKFMFSFDACKKVEITGNSFDGEVLGKNIQLKLMYKSDLTIDKKQRIIISNLF